MNTEELINQLLPIMIDWANEQEKKILQNGNKLLLEQIVFAEKIGIIHPQKIRILYVDEIPFPQNKILFNALSEIGLSSSVVSGLTINYGIYITNSCVKDRKILLHELAHVKQYERVGSIDEFLKQYIRECSIYGYHFAPLEIEASDMVKKMGNL